MYPTDAKFSDRTDQFLNTFHNAIFQDIVQVNFSFAHGSHFYLYMIFSKSFRKGFVKRVLKRAQDTSQSAAGTGGTGSTKGFKA